jgi:thiamine-triphosphatase
VKIRTGNDFINLAFMEVDGNNAIKEVIEQNLTVFINGFNIEEILEPCAEFITKRESWIMDGKFKINVDTIDFRYIVGKVELTRIFRFINGEYSKEEEEREKLKQEIDYDIKAFM